MDIVIEKPHLSVPVSLVVDDPTPCINPLYYYRLQVNQANYQQHEQLIPLAFLTEFITTCHQHGIRGKFTVIPYPAGLSSILDGWDGCTRTEIGHWLTLVRTELVPDFDITPEILTHTRALDLMTRQLLPQSEEDWITASTPDVMTRYFTEALHMLVAAGFRPVGITQPCYFHGSHADYADATLRAMRAIGGPNITYFFIDAYVDDLPVPPPEVVFADRDRGEAVVHIFDYCHDYFWQSQRPESRRAADIVDRFISADGQSGRLADLAAHDAWLVFVCHWQSLYSDGSREGLAALGEVAARLKNTYGNRLRWMPLSEIARYCAASAMCEMHGEQAGDTWIMTFDSAVECPNFTVSINLPESTAYSIDHIQAQTPNGATYVLQPEEDFHGILGTSKWVRQDSRVFICFHLQRGIQSLQIHNE